MVGFHYLKFLMTNSSRDYSPKVTKAPPKIWMIQFAIKPQNVKIVYRSFVSIIAGILAFQLLRNFFACPRGFGRKPINGGLKCKRKTIVYFEL
jgi:hypothetical protein